MNAKEILQSRLNLDSTDLELSCQRINEIAKILDPDIQVLIDEAKKEEDNTGKWLIKKG